MNRRKERVLPASVKNLLRRAGGEAEAGSWVRLKRRGKMGRCVVGRPLVARGEMQRGSEQA
jgi:hypothetical protein